MDGTLRSNQGHRIPKARSSPPRLQPLQRGEHHAPPSSRSSSALRFSNSAWIAATFSICLTTFVSSFAASIVFMGPPPAWLEWHLVQHLGRESCFQRRARQHVQHLPRPDLVLSQRACPPRPVRPL